MVYKKQFKGYKLPEGGKVKDKKPTYSTRMNTQKLASDNMGNYVAPHKTVKPEDMPRNVLTDPNSPLVKIAVQTYLDQSKIGRPTNNVVELSAKYNNPTYEKLNYGLEFVKPFTPVVGDAVINTIQQMVEHADHPEYPEGGKIWNPKLAGADLAFQDWYKKNTLEGKNGIPHDSPESVYDFYSYYKNTPTPLLSNPNAHFPDTYKLSNHPTFSNESYYAGNGAKGYWKGDKFMKYVKGGRLPKYNYGTDKIGGGAGANVGAGVGTPPPPTIGKGAYDLAGFGLI